MKFGICLAGKPIVIKTDMVKWYNETLQQLDDEALLKYIGHLDLVPIPSANSIYTPNNYHFSSISDMIDNDPGFFLNINNCYYTYQLRFTDYDTTVLNKGICCIL
jgi:hypothetical protein